MVAQDDRQICLFVDTLIDVPVKDDVKLMEYPWFSLQKHGRTEPFHYEKQSKHGVIRIDVKPGPYGMATIFDKDLLIYCQTLLMDRINRGLPVSRTLAINLHDYMRVTGRSTGKDGYQLVKKSLQRLQTTVIETNIKSGDEAQERGFGWLDDYEIKTKQVNGRRVMTHVEITLNRWTYKAITEDRRVITISKDYYNLESGMERRLYELARKHCGNQEFWHISLPKLAERCGTTQDLRSFKRDLSRIIEGDNIPDYHIAFAERGVALTLPDEDDPAATVSGGPKPKRRRSANDRVIVTFMPKNEGKRAANDPKTPLVEILPPEAA